MLKATLKHTILFKNLIGVLKELVVDCVLQCKPNGLFLQAMDASHVALCTLHLKDSGFDSYTCDSAFEIGLHLPSLDCILRCIKKDDVLHLQAEPETDALRVDFTNTNTAKQSHYSLKLMTIDTEQIGLGDIEYDTRITMHSSSFSEMCKNTQLLGDTCTLTCTSNTLTMDVNGDMGTGQIVLQHDIEYSNEDCKKDCVCIDTSVSCTLNFSLKYLTVFSKAMSLSSEVILCMHDDKPLQVQYSMQNIGELCFYVAPKISDIE